MNIELQRIYSRGRINDRIVNELCGLCHGALADGKIDQSEVEYLQKWLVANSVATKNPVVALLLGKIGPMLEKGRVSESDSAAVLQILSDFVGGRFELGEVAKASKLPLDLPYPEIAFQGSRFCFTGTFAYGSRKDCEGAVEEKGGVSGTLTRKTDYLVIGSYVTDSWSNSSFGRKIEKAVAMKAKGRKLAIVGEDHWISCL